MTFDTDDANGTVALYRTEGGVVATLVELDLSTEGETAGEALLELAIRLEDDGIDVPLSDSDA